MKNSINHMYSIPRNRIGEPLTLFEQQHILNFESEIDLTRPKVLNPTRFHNFSFIEMNSTYIEMIDYYYPRIGRSLGVSFLWINVLILWPIFCIIFFTLILNPPFFIAVPFFLFFLIYMSYISYVNIKALKYYELQGYYCLPARFNRKNKKIYLYLKDGQQIERGLEQVVICISEIKAFMDGKEYTISVFELGHEGKITSHSTIGKASYHKPDIIELWKFINIYWVYGPEPLMPSHVVETIDLYDRNSYLTYCHDVKSKEEKISDSWEIIRLEHYMNPLFFILCIPYDLLHLAARRICLKRHTMPVWHDEIEQKNEVDPNDPYCVTAKDNFEFGMWSMKRPKVK